MPVSLQNQVALIVGASSGIGRATVVALAREGVLVMASARREDRLRSLQEQLATERHAIEIYPADASDGAAMERLAEETRTRLGPVDIVVYATGTNTPDRSMTRLNPPLWAMLIAVNLNGASYVTNAVLPQLRERRS